MLGFVIVEHKTFDERDIEEYKKLIPKIIEEFNGKVVAKNDQNRHRRGILEVRNNGFG